MRQQRDMTLDTYRQLCLSYIYRLAWTSTGSDGTWRECTINAGDGESLKHNSVISRVCGSFCLNTRVINSSLFHRTVLISVQTHQTRLHGCLQEATIPAKSSFLPIPRRKLVETDCLLRRIYVLRWLEYTTNAGDGEALKLHSVSFRVINSLLFQRTVLISVQTHQTRLHGCLLQTTIPAKASFLPIPRRKLVETVCLLHRVYVHAFPSLCASTHTFNARGDGSLKSYRNFNG